MENHHFPMVFLWFSDGFPIKHGDYRVAFNVPISGYALCGLDRRIEHHLPGDGEARDVGSPVCLAPAAAWIDRCGFVERNQILP